MRFSKKKIINIKLFYTLRTHALVIILIIHYESKCDEKMCFANVLKIAFGEIQKLP